MVINIIILLSQLGEDQGISECKSSGSRRTVNYGYGELLEAAIYEEDGRTLVQKTSLLGQEGLAFKVNKEYVVRAKFSAKKFSSFGSYSKYMGIKVSENFVAASENTKQAYKVRHAPVSQC